MSSTDAKQPINYTLAIRVPQELRDRLQRIADSERRPMSQLARNVLEDYANQVDPKDEEVAA
jgi:predicted transcriptional regulator